MNNDDDCDGGGGGNGLIFRFGGKQKFYSDIQKPHTHHHTHTELIKCIHYCKKKKISHK